MRFPPNETPMMPMPPEDWESWTEIKANRVAEIIRRWQGNPGVPASAYLPLAKMVIAEIEKDLKR
jgi:hypothetical protein